MHSHTPSESLQLLPKQEKTALELGVKLKQFGKD